MNELPFQSVTPRPRVRDAVAEASAKVTRGNLNFYMRTSRLEEHHPHARNHLVTAFIGPSGLRQVDPVAHLQPDVRSLPASAPPAS